MRQSMAISPPQPRFSPFLLPLTSLPSLARSIFIVFWTSFMLLLPIRLGIPLPKFIRFYSPLSFPSLTFCFFCISFVKFWVLKAALLHSFFPTSFLGTNDPLSPGTVMRLVITFWKIEFKRRSLKYLKLVEVGFFSWLLLPSLLKEPETDLCYCSSFIAT